MNIVIGAMQAGVVRAWYAKDEWHFRRVVDPHDYKDKFGMGVTNIGNAWIVGMYRGIAKFSLRWKLIKYVRNPVCDVVHTIACIGEHLYAVSTMKQFIVIMDHDLNVIDVDNVARYAEGVDGKHGKHGVNHWHPNHLEFITPDKAILSLGWGQGLAFIDWPTRKREKFIHVGQITHHPRWVNETKSIIVSGCPDLFEIDENDNVNVILPGKFKYLRGISEPNQENKRLLFDVRTHNIYELYRKNDEWISKFLFTIPEGIHGKTGYEAVWEERPTSGLAKTPSRKKYLHAKDRLRALGYL